MLSILLMLCSSTPFTGRKHSFAVIIFAMSLFYISTNCTYVFATSNCNLISQLEKAEEGGIKVHTDHGEVIMADVVLVATGNFTSCIEFVEKL